MTQAHDYTKIAFDLIDDLDRLTEVDGVVNRVSATLADFGYTSFVITGVPEPPQRLEPYILPQWLAQGMDRALHQIELLCGRSGGRVVPPYCDAERWPRAAEVMAVAREFGLNKGFLVPIVRSTGFQACVTMAGERPDYEPKAKRALHLVSMYAHARCAALLGCEADGQRRRVLSERERDILAWAAEGKSSWEIGTILGLSERTVNWHVEQSKKKLDAVTRTQAVIKALRSGEI